MISRILGKKEPPVQASKELEYEDLLKIEFLDMLERFQSDRTSFHVYAIGRCATTATLVGFSYNYSIGSRGGVPVIIKTIDLKEYGKLTFEIPSGSAYGTLRTPNSHEVIQNMIKNFPTQTTVINFSGTK